MPALTVFDRLIEPMAFRLSFNRCPERLPEQKIIRSVPDQCTKVHAGCVIQTQFQKPVGSQADSVALSAEFMAQGADKTYASLKAFRP